MKIFNKNLFYVGFFFYRSFRLKYILKYRLKYTFILLVLDNARKMSIVDPTSCGFGKVFSYHLFTEKPNSKKKPTENFKEHSSRILRDQYARFVSQFYYFQPGIDFTKFKSNFRKITKNLQSLGEKNSRKKKTILTTFSSDNWQKLKEQQKCHSLFDCQACQKSANLKSALSMFTNQSSKYKFKAKK